MSTLNVSNITDGTTTVGTSYVVNGSAKAWVNFNGQGTIAARDSLNLSSLTDNAIGDYTFSFTSDFSAADYALSFMVRSTNSDGNRGASGIQLSDIASPPMSAGSFRFFTSYGASASTSGAKEDCDYVMVAAHGDLA
jgi:hypothetical protein